MEIQTLFFTCVAVISVSGQFLGTRPDSVLLNLRRNPIHARFEIQPTISREIEYQGGETARSSSQGRRHIDSNHHNIHSGHNNRNDNGFERKPEFLYQNENKNYEFMQPTYNEEQVNHDDRQSARLQQQNQDNYVRESSIQYTNRNSENRNQNNRKVIPPVYDQSLKTNLDNKHLHQNTQASPSQEDHYNQNNYPASDNTRTNEYHIDRASPTSANTNDRHITKASQTPDLYNYVSNGNVRTNENPTNQEVDRASDHSSSNGDRNRNAETISGRSIDSNGYDNRQDLTRNNNKNSAGKLNRQNTDNRRGNDNRNYESNRQTTEPSRRVTVEDRLVTGGTKSTQDNELASKTHPDGRTRSKEDKWVWGDGSETTTTTTTSTTLPVVDDRAAFEGGKCPTGQVKINNMCVNKD